MNIWRGEMHMRAKQTRAYKIDETMRVWIARAKVEELHARSVDKVFDSKEKAQKYVVDQGKIEHFVNFSGIDWSIEEWEVE